MKQNINCQVCHKEVNSEIGKGCELCGMPLEDPSREFCSKICRTKYIKINGDKEIKK